MGNICYIIGAGADYGLDFVPSRGDLVIAADGGYRSVQKAGIRPHQIIGDFDSLGAAPCDEHVITLPKVKDVTDTFAAMEYALGKGYREFHLYGCTGGRAEHTLANLQTAADLAAKGCRCLLFDESQIITALCGVMEFPREAAGFFSLFSHTETCRVSLQGLKYELSGYTLTNRFPLGVSNEFTGVPAVITVDDGVAIVVYDRSLKNLPTRIDKTFGLD